MCGGEWRKVKLGDIESGVIQGSCLGPALFLVFINDIDTAVDLTRTFLSKFADDTKMACIVESAEDRRKFQEEVDSRVC